MRLVLDTDVLVAAVRSELGASRKLLVGVLRERVTLLATTALFLEYEAVLRRPQHLRAVGMSVAEVDDILDGLANVVVPVEVVYRWRPQLIDAGDELVLEAAVNGRADRLVTFNIRHFAPAERFGIRICRPGDVVGSWR
ncbi:putative toxin-antitoxin system toxin component, PIN family [Vineibacter terrae]|uniref:Putative toxin-antitoxin system toxin component, PIN family n=1 Tax=Vineibacter terrae TaxID=2586908 RepID=A0A5C8PD01_9HYPH|nr:putative toxin-antitoxin system toxin component, PIN family [Vineibacter terrae]TXL71387.1 putative toxin-antitoxin system toxin component, PIN family [Vineibacter terrae]